MRKLAATSLLAGAAVSAEAQQYSDKQIRAIASRYAACVIKTSAARARRFVVSEDQPPPIAGDCLNQAARFQGGEMRFPGAMYRYSLAEALVMRDYASGLPSGLATAPAIEHPQPEPIDAAKLPRNARRAADVRERFARAEGFRVLDIVTDCVARREPENALALIRSPLDGPAETTAFTALKPTLAACLPQGETVRMNRSVLRGSLASNLYRLAYAVRPVVA